VTAVPPPDRPVSGSAVWPRWAARPRWTARLRLTLWYGGLFLLAGLVLVATSYLLVRQRLLPQGGGGKATTVQSPTGTVVCSPQGACQTLPPGAGTLAPDPNRSIVVTGGQLSALKTSFLSDAMRTFLQTMLGVLALTALGSLGLGWVVAGRVLRPLQRITATAKRLSERTLDQRIALDGPDDELKELADTFDRMLARLDAAFDAQRRFAANASHAPRWRSAAPRSTSPWPTPTPPTRSCAPWPNGSATPPSAASG
jgi:HAMP domain-containing protein